MGKLTVRQLIEKYGEPDRFKDFWGIMNYAMSKEMGVENALKVACSISKEPQHMMCICFAKKEGDLFRFRVKDSDHIVVSKLRIVKDE